ncbi:hypothetical protein [Trichothermofontia sp.]
MAYSDFTLERVANEFDLEVRRSSLFPEVAPLAMSHWLEQTLAISRQFMSAAASEKARSELVVMPLLLEIANRNPGKVAIYSGKNLEVDRDRGLVGECDFILALGEMTDIIVRPICCLVQAKKQDLESGIDQCSAQMVAAQQFNQRRHPDLETIFGCVTTGDDWQFLRLRDRNFQIDNRLYFINEIPLILSCLQTILDFYQPNLINV